MEMIFDELKATQAAAMLLEMAGGKMNYMALIKHLYKIDREALRRWGVAVTTDRYVSMKNGPVTSRIYDLIKASKNDAIPATTWKNHIEALGNVEVHLRQPAGDSEIAPIEKRLIQEIFEIDGHRGPFDLAGATHTEFAEWKDPGSSSIPISLTDILQAVGATEDEASHAADSIDIQRAIHTLGCR